MIILYYISDIISISLHMHLSLWLFKMKQLTGVLLMCLWEKKGRSNCLSWQSTTATLFSNFHHEIAFMKSDPGGGEGWIVQKTKAKKQRESQNPMIISRANISLDLIFLIIEHYLNVLWVALDIKMWLRISRSLKPHQRIKKVCQLPLTAWSWQRGRSPAEWQGESGWQSIIALFAL